MARDRKLRVARGFLAAFGGKMITITPATSMSHSSQSKSRKKAQTLFRCTIFGIRVRIEWIDRMRLSRNMVFETTT